MVSVFSLLPLLMLLPATSGHVVIMPNPRELCPLVHIVEHELCTTNQHNQHNGSVSPIPELCVLLQKYNASFCSSANAHAHATKGHEGMSDDAMSVRILQNEFYANKSNDEHNELNEHHDIHKLCPILNFMEQELCSSPRKEPEVAVEFEFDPKQLCPLLNLTYTELCD
jgi:hypothetical protein